MAPSKVTMMSPNPPIPARLRNRPRQPTHRHTGSTGVSGPLVPEKLPGVTERKSWARWDCMSRVVLSSRRRLISSTCTYVGRACLTSAPLASIFDSARLYISSSRKYTDHAFPGSHITCSDFLFPLQVSHRLSLLHSCYPHLLVLFYSYRLITAGDRHLLLTHHHHGQLKIGK